MEHLTQELDFSVHNSWLQLLMPEHRPPQPAVEKKRPAARRLVYTEDHPLVVRARQLYASHTYSNKQIARMINVDSKAITRWIRRGLFA